MVVSLTYKAAFKIIFETFQNVESVYFKRDTLTIYRKYAPVINIPYNRLIDLKVYDTL